MASQQEVKQYLAYWFQLGKQVLLQKGQEKILPKIVIQGNHYSEEFERCWQQILQSGNDSYLEGTSQSIEQLLTDNWEVSPCARCDMPVPIIQLGIQSIDCPCNDLPNWPNQELPKPRSPVDSDAHLLKLQERLRQLGTRG
jgi:hypothetical protein